MIDLDFGRVYTGEEIADYIEEITPLGFSDDRLTKSGLKIIMREAKKFSYRLRRIDLTEAMNILSNDSSAIGYLAYDDSRYYGSDFEGFYRHSNDEPAYDVSEDDLYNPIVIANGKLVDGYSRLSEHIHNSDETDILAFINI